MSTSSARVYSPCRMASCTTVSQHSSASRKFPRPFMGLVPLPPPSHGTSRCAQTGGRHGAPRWGPSCLTAPRRAVCLAERRGPHPWCASTRDNTGQGSTEAGRKLCRSGNITVVRSLLRVNTCRWRGSCDVVVGALLARHLAFGYTWHHRLPVSWV